MTMMLSRRLLIARLPFVSTRQPSIFPIAVAIAGRGYATAPGPQPKLHPLSPPIPGELDPRFGDLPDWTVPKINRQNLTETPVDPYYDQQNRRYFGEPVSEEDEVLSVFAIDTHDHVTVPFALKWFAGVAVAFTGLCYVIVWTWPGEIAMPRTFPHDGLVKELGVNQQARTDAVPQERSPTL